MQHLLLLGEQFSLRFFSILALQVSRADIQERGGGRK
jgi:hypothetical protein